MYLTICRMENFPPNQWDVRHLADYEDITVPAPSGSRFHLQALLIGRPAFGREGQFRFLISGNNNMSFNVRLRDIIDDPCFEDMYVNCQMKSGSQVCPYHSYITNSSKEIKLWNA